MQTGCGNDADKVKGSNPNISADPDYENIWKIFVHFKCQIHTEGLSP